MTRFTSASFPALLICIGLLVALWLMRSPTVYADNFTFPGCGATIQDCLDSMDHGDTLQVEAGAYITDELVISKAITLSGVASNATILDGNNAHPVISIPAGITEDVRIQNLTIQRGLNTVSDGGGINAASPVRVHQTRLISNVAAGQGGAIYATTPITVVASHLLNNTADDGAALFTTSGEGQLTQSCIVGNQAAAVRNVGGSTFNAMENWWGASDGPGGDGPGSGDETLGMVTFAPFHTFPQADCPAPDLSLSKHAAPAGSLLPGQSVTYTLAFTNLGAAIARGSALTDALPGLLDVTGVLSGGIPITQTAPGAFDLGEAPAGASGFVTLVARVPATLTAPLTVTNTAAISASGEATTTNNTATAINAVDVPTVNWANPTLSVNEGSGSAGLALSIAPPNPHASTVVSVTTTDGDAQASSDYTDPAGVYTIPAGADLYTVTVPITDDMTVESNESFTATVTAQAGGQTGSPAQTIVTILDNDAPGLAFTKTVGIQGIIPECTDTSQSQVPISTVVVYCYSVTNTGSISWTEHSLVDSHLGAIFNSEAITLAPGATYTATVTKTVSVSVTNVATWTAQSQNASENVANTAQADVIVSGPTDDQDLDNIPDNIETADDADADNVPNFLDTDSDNDGVPDEEECPSLPCPDEDGDGTPDFLDPDTANRTFIYLMPIMRRDQ